MRKAVRCPWCSCELVLDEQRYPLGDPAAVRHVRECVVLRLSNNSKPKPEDTDAG